MTGKPTVLGRAANISDYVKYGKTKATIEIELFVAMNLVLVFDF